MNYLKKNHSREQTLRCGSELRLACPFFAPKELSDLAYGVDSRSLSSAFRPLRIFRLTGRLIVRRTRRNLPEHRRSLTRLRVCVSCDAGLR